MAPKIASYKYHILTAAIILFALFFRLWHIEFGLPHSFTADEPEIAELAIKYTYEFASIVKNGDYYKLIPINFVYGTFPAYLLTAATMIFSKTANLLSIGFSKTTLYIFMRSLNAILSLLILPGATLLYYKIFKNHAGTLLTFGLLALNWKLIVHAHYINADIFVAVLLTLAYLTAFLYYKKSSDFIYTALTGILIGLAIGTKITAGLTLPLFLYLFVFKKDLKGALGFILVAFLAFEITNPFSIIFFNEFIFRVYSMLTLEGGMVFDSVDTNPFKYLIALSWMVTPALLVTSLYGIYLSIKGKTDRPVHVFLIGHIILYLIFYSVQSRRVDRWLLPIVPIVIIYASYGLIKLKELINNRTIYLALVAVISAYYLYFPILLLTEFRRYTPKSEAYLWVRDNLPVTSTKLVISEEGLDPMNKAPLATVVTYQVYGAKNAQYGYPPDPFLYDYVILSSRPMANFKRSKVIEAYPLYVKAWENFEKNFAGSDKFTLIKSFELPKPNLIPLSNVFIYQKR